MPSVWFVAKNKNISHGGENDVKKHIKINNHQQTGKSVSSSKKMDIFLIGFFCNNEIRMFI